MCTNIRLWPRWAGVPKEVMVGHQARWLCCRIDRRAVGAQPKIMSCWIDQPRIDDPVGRRQCGRLWKHHIVTYDGARTLNCVGACRHQDVILHERVGGRRSTTDGTTLWC